MASGQDLQLLGVHGSPFVARVKIALALKGIEYEFLEQDLQNKSELLLKSNPVHKKIPVLIHGGRPICESLVIVQYIDEAWTGVGPSILPSDPYDRAVARFWASYVEEKVFSAIRGVVTNEGEEAKAKTLPEAAAVLKVLEEGLVMCSGGKAFFGGDEIGFVDITFGCCLSWIKAVQKLDGFDFFNEAGTPLLASWAEHFLAHGVASRELPPVETVTAFLLRRREAAAAAGAAAGGN